MRLEVKDAKFSYKADKVLFSNLSFDLNPGQILAIMGPNGIGKTSLIRAICGFESLNEGEITFDGKNLKAYDKKEFWEQVSYIPQKREAAFAYTGLDMVVFGLAGKIGPFGNPSKNDYKKAIKTMEDLEISHLADKLSSKLSGGEVQMLIIARALVKNPRLLILDEAESGLDFKNQLKIITTLKDLAKKKGLTVIFNTHYPNYALKIADKVLILRKNARYFYGSREIINEENIKEAFGVRALIENVKTKDGIEKIMVPYSLV